MPAEIEHDSQLEIAHVLFTDIVGYSKLPIDLQSEHLRQLNQIVRDTEHFRSAEAAGKLVRLPTGDGMALAFFTSPDAPVRCAIEVARSLQKHPQLHLRMGIDSGPVEQVADVNDRANVAGAGINMAQRVMDCGDAGHILLSQRVAGDLGQYSKWQPQLHDLGEVEVKHGVKIGVVNFFDGEAGNPATPEKIRRLRHLQSVGARRRIVAWALGSTLVLAALAGAFWFQSHRTRPSKPTVVTIPEKSIAVLPFENLSGEKGDAFFADGIQDDILASVGKIKDLKVIGRASVMNYRGAALAGKLREIGQALQVSHVLEGSVRRSASRVVVNVALIDTRNDNQIWSQHYDRTLSDTLSLQGELALAIARELRAVLSATEKSIASTQPTSNTEAYIAYLHGLESDHKAFAHLVDAETAEGFYQEAIDLDPNFALARARLSTLVAQLRPKAGKLKARVEAEEALRLQPELGEAHLAHAYYFYRCEENFDEALRELTRASELLPNSSEVARTTGFIHRGQGNWRRAFEDFEKAVTLDPENTEILAGLAFSYRYARNWAAAIRVRTRLNTVMEKENGPDQGSSGLGADVGLAIDQFFATSSVAPLQNCLNLLKANPAADQFDVHMLSHELAMIARNYDEAERELAQIPPEKFAELDFPSRNVMLGRIQSARGDPLERIAATLEPDLKLAREKLAQDAMSFQNHSSLGIILALTGRKQDAVREGMLAVEVAPRFYKDLASSDLALIFAKTDKVNEAVSLLEGLLTRPGQVDGGHIASITWADLRMRREWDSLRDNPRFKKIVEGPEPVTLY
jgi:TolB-like protein/Flp pilus assembly protein TadD